MFTLPTSLIFKQSISTMVTSLQYFCLTKINIYLIYTDVQHRKSSHFRGRQLNNELKELIIYLKMFFNYFSFNSFYTHMHTHECVDEEEEEGGEGEGGLFATHLCMMAQLDSD